MNKERESLHIRINLDAPVNGLIRRLRHANDNLRFGLACDVGSVEDVSAPSMTGITYAIGGAEIRDLDRLRTGFRSWVIASALRDSIEALLLYLDEVRKVSVLLSYGPTVDLTSDEWNATLVRGQKQFHRLGLRRKLDALKQIDESLQSEYEEEIATINRARNCLVHRFGAVTDEDTDGTDRLTVRWRKNEIVAEIDGTPTPIGPGFVAKDVTPLYLHQNVPVSKEFSIGETILLSADEFGELSWTVIVFAVHFREKVETFGLSRGVVPREVG